MDCERKINLIEGVPLNTAGAANIFLNTGKNTKVNSPNGTVIHLKTEKSAAPDVGVHINTTFAIASSKKIKLLFVLNFLLSVLCMAASCSAAVYYWSEVAAVRRQVDFLRDQLGLQAARANDQAHQSALVSNPPLFINSQEREPRFLTPKDQISSNPKKYYVQDLGEDILLVDLSKKNLNNIPDKPEKIPVPVFSQKDLLVIHFNGAQRELNLGSKGIIGPWSRDTEVSSKNSAEKVELHTDYFTVKESGLYLIYAQITYLTHAPNCFYIWARQPEKESRLLGSCATGDDSSGRPLEKSQISCSAQTIARLHQGDTVNLSQREHNRTLWLKPGYSYFGFVKLSS